MEKNNEKDTVGTGPSRKPTLAEESKPIATQVGDAIRPAAETYSKGMQQLVNEFFAGSKGPMGEAARANFKAQDNAKPIAEFVAP